ncbi:MAG: hypothetical protein IT366_07255 [Candidatus Hydrogenedentes bacterium]|nr:hypothetical protein [Candidatus Hydrogenedentota bacterium]
MMHLAFVAAVGILAGAQQPSVNAQELPKPGQSQPAAPPKPAPKPAQQPAPAPQAAPAQPQPQPQPAPAQQPAPAPAPAAAPAPAPVGGQHVPAPEETERGKQGKPVGAFWTVLPGK